MQKPYYYKGKITNYMVRDDGKVYDALTGLFLKEYMNNSGYIMYSLSIIDENGKKYTVRASSHRMVAETFIPNPDHKPFVNHKDGVKTNNEASNLEWVTPSENNKHAYATGLHKPLDSEKVSFTVYTADQVRNVCELLSKGMRPMQIEKLTGVKSKSIYEIRLKQIWKNIVKDYNFQRPKYISESPIWTPEQREIAEKTLDENLDLLPSEVAKKCNLPLDPEFLKCISNWKCYKRRKVQRLSRKGVEMQASGISKQETSIIFMEEDIVYHPIEIQGSS